MHGINFWGWGDNGPRIAEPDRRMRVGMEKLEGVVDYPLAALGLGALLLIDRVIYGDHHADHSPGKLQMQQSIYPYVLMALLSQWHLH